MAERTLVERLRAIAEPRFSPLFPEEVAALHEAAAALERLEKLERFLDREGIRRGPIDHGMPTPEIVDRVEAYGYECAIRAIRATPAPAPQEIAEFETALDTLLGPQPDNFAGLLARQSILAHQLKLVEQALDRATAAPAPQQGGPE